MKVEDKRNSRVVPRSMVFKMPASIMKVLHLESVWGGPFRKTGRREREREGGKDRCKVKLQPTRPSIHPSSILMWIDICVYLAASPVGFDWCDPTARLKFKYQKTGVSPRSDHWWGRWAITMTSALRVWSWLLPQ